MYSYMCDGIEEAFRKTCQCLLANGEKVKVKEYTTLELHPYMVGLKDATQRTLLYPGRGNDPFATLFETLWVLSGSTNIHYLKHFLPRAGDFSDDGETWRAGYGGRIFHAGKTDDIHSGRYDVDQFKYVYETLRKDQGSRQAIITLWDPTKEYDAWDSKDLPCSNWLAFTIRNGKLDCTLTMRSNDVFWGFSNINVYEFTVLQEIMAGMLGVPVGQYFHFTNSMHCYTGGGFNCEKNFEKIKQCAEIDIQNYMEYVHSEYKFESCVDDYESTIKYYHNLYDYVCEMIKCVSTSAVENKARALLSMRDDKHTIYKLLALRILADNYDRTDSVPGVGTFISLYDRVMQGIAYSTLKLSCHYWMLKKWKVIKPMDLNGAAKSCLTTE
jgi:thymidylate synthase